MKAKYTVMVCMLTQCAVACESTVVAELFEERPQPEAQTIAIDDDVYQIRGNSISDCTIDYERELLVHSTDVTDDVRVDFPGPWSIGHLLIQVAGQKDPQEFVLRMFDALRRDRRINGFEVPGSAPVWDKVMIPWLKKSRDGGRGGLDFKSAPFRLLAIVNRVDLRKIENDELVFPGEVRFVYGLLSLFGSSGLEVLNGTVSIDFRIPAETISQVNAWAATWHQLNEYEIDSIDFKDELSRITERAVRRDLGGGRLERIRVNEQIESRTRRYLQFAISTRTGFLRGDIVSQTPDASLNESRFLAAYINAFEESIVAGDFELPPTWMGQPVLSGVSEIFDGIDEIYDAPGINNPEARHALSLNTCTGCHGRETHTQDAGHFHIGVRGERLRAPLSPYLTGVSVIDPVNLNEVRNFGELERRRFDLCTLLGSD